MTTQTPPLQHVGNYFPHFAIGKKPNARKREYIPQALSLLTLTGAVMLVAIGGSVTSGAHRYYAHRAFKATFGLQCWMIGLFTIAGQVRIEIPASVAAVV